MFVLFCLKTTKDTINVSAFCKIVVNAHTKKTAF